MIGTSARARGPPRSGGGFPSKADPVVAVRFPGLTCGVDLREVASCATGRALLAQSAYTVTVLPHVAYWRAGWDEPGPQFSRLKVLCLLGEPLRPRWRVIDSPIFVGMGSAARPL